VNEHQRYGALAVGPRAGLLRCLRWSGWVPRILDTECLPAFKSGGLTCGDVLNAVASLGANGVAHSVVARGGIVRTAQRKGTAWRRAGR
jgi:hypothetical protein